jgi:peptidoglycan LD-endopeptidase LytH
MIDQSSFTTDATAIIKGLEKNNTVNIDLSVKNLDLNKVNLKNTTDFQQYIEEYMSRHKAKYAIGGYNEHREIYRRSNHFNNEEEERCIHLGMDVWTKAGTIIYNPLEGIVHSIKNNDNYGDYGPTVIIEHIQKGIKFYLLYGHLASEIMNRLSEGQKVQKGEVIAYVGNHPENGDWPPHLHFQMINDMQDFKGDYPGVCKMSERAKYLKNCPDPSSFLMI